MLVPVQHFEGKVTLYLSTLSTLGILQGEVGARAQLNKDCNLDTGPNEESSL